MEVRINKEVRDYQESLFFGLSLRQFLFALLAVLAAVLASLFRGSCDRFGLCDFLGVRVHAASYCRRYLGTGNCRVELCGRIDLQHAGTGRGDQNERPAHPRTDGSGVNSLINWKLPFSFNNSSTDQNGGKDNGEKQICKPNRT